MTDFHYEQEPPRSVCQQLAPGIRRMVAANPSQMTYHGTNTYFIEAPQGVFVLDPGPASDAKHFDAVVSALDENGAGIIVSHHHSDHFGSVQRLQNATGLNVYASRVFADDTFRPDVALSDGDEVGGLVVLHTPGHASDHLCFRRGDGVLFTGDHIMTWNSSIVMLPDGDMAAYCAQLERLIAGNDRLYLPGHGPPLNDPLPYARKLLDHRLQRDLAVWKEIAQEPVTAAQISKKLYGKTDERLAWAAERNVEAHLDKMRKEGRAVCENGKWSAIKS